VRYVSQGCCVPVVLNVFLTRYVCNFAGPHSLKPDGSWSLAPALIVMGRTENTCMIYDSYEYFKKLYQLIYEETLVVKFAIQDRSKPFLGASLRAFRELGQPMPDIRDRRRPLLDVLLVVDQLVYLPRRPSPHTHG
jgi:hypothetical protein